MCFLATIILKREKSICLVPAEIGWTCHIKRTKTKIVKMSVKAEKYKETQFKNAHDCVMENDNKVSCRSDSYAKLGQHPAAASAAATSMTAWLHCFKKMYKGLS